MNHWKTFFLPSTVFVIFFSISANVCLCVSRQQQALRPPARTASLFVSTSTSLETFFSFSVPPRFNPNLSGELGRDLLLVEFCRVLSCDRGLEMFELSSPELP